MGNALFDSIFPGINGIAQNLVNLMGAEVTIVYKGSATRTMTDNSVVYSDEIRYTIDASPPLRVKSKHVNNTTIKATDSYIIIPLFDFNDTQIVTPVINGTVHTPDELQWTIVEVDPIHSGYETSAYRLFIRRN